jgi:SAM-dependent methyltransferase
MTESAWREVRRKINQVGVIGTCQHLCSWCFNELRQYPHELHDAVDSFDAQYGTETAEIVRVGGLDIGNESLKHANRYEAVQPRIFARMVRALPIPYQDFLFVDFGCGKGRALLLASEYSFKRAIGIEISHILTERARENINIFNRQRQNHTRIDVICADALDYDLPSEPTVLYFYNPFDEQSIRRVLLNVERSLARQPRKIYVLDHRPLPRHVWDESGFFQLTNDETAYAIYESR